MLEYQIHPNYRIDVTPRQDVALLLLNEQVEYTGFVHPACLPYGRYTSEYSSVEAEANLVQDADYCWFVGWGFTNAIPNYEQIKVYIIYFRVNKIPGIGFFEQNPKCLKILGISLVFEE